MYLKRLDIQGFKTFASRIALEFRPGITAVVGPNGSGKSNLADSVRWVLGEQSFAALRCRRAEELIYSGGGRRAPAGFAEVSLTIDNADRLLPLDFDEVTITRRSTRAGDSEYFINRARVRLRDVLEATAPLGGSYTIINQGLVDAALTLRPEERRRLFEDAAEIGGFELRKAEALRRLRETEGNLQRVGDLLAELEPRLRALKRQAGQARQHRELTDELHALQRQSYALQWREARALTTRTRLEAARTEQALDQSRAAQSAVGAELHALRSALRGRREALGLLHQRSSDLHRRAEQAQRELAVGTERLAALARRSEELERRRTDLALRRQEADAQCAAAAAEVERAAAALDTGRAELGRAEAELSGREAARRMLAQELRAAQDAAVRAAAAVAEQASRAEQLTAQRARLTREGAELALAVAQAEERVRSAQAQVEVAKTELTQAEAQRQTVTATEQAARAELERLRAARAAAEEERAAARRALADVEARHDSLSRLARSYAGAFAGVRAAMQWAERAGRPGFALVQAIIRTPAELETAIETALGSRLQNIVVERWEDAEAAIDELKRSGAGRATFMPLDSLRSQRIENEEWRIAKSYGNVDTNNSSFSILYSQSPVLGVAADLVEYDDRYAPVARQLLGRVLVVRDLPTARAELRRLPGGWTIVTLAGEQVSSGGSVTGGAQAKESGALRRERELRELPGQVTQARAALAAAEARRGELEAHAQQLGQRLRELEAAARDATRQLESRRSAVEAAARRAAQAEQENEWARQRRERLEHEIAALDGQERAITERRAEAAQAQAAAEQRLAEQRARQEAEAQADRAAQERLAGLRATAGAMEGQLRAQRSLLSAHEQSLAQAERQIAEATAAVDELAAERARLDAAHAAAEATHRTLLAEIDALRAQIDPAEAELQGEESRQAELEQREERATAALLHAESTHTRAALDAQRAVDRQEALFERAVADGVDVTAVDETKDQGPRTKDQGPRTNDQDQDQDQRPTTNDQNQDQPDAHGPADAAIGPSSLVLRPAEVGPSSLVVGPESRSLSPAELQSQIDTLKTRILRLGAVNPLALEEYEEASERQTFLSGQVTDLRQASATLLELIAELDQQMGARFARTFQAVAVEFERSFTQLFGGGSAKLLLTGAGEQNGVEEPAAEGHDPLHGQGIEILVRPPGKKQQNISLLSGGERTLTAAALLFAILKVNPSPFCILDETDAALDESNVGRFREALQRLTEQTQFILITHNRGTIEAADTLYGVTMGDDGASKTISLRVEEYVAAP